MSITSQFLTVLQSRHNGLWIRSPLHCPCAERLLADGGRVGGAEGVNGGGGVGGVEEYCLSDNR